MIEAAFPDKLAFLFDARRYKVAYGGRGSGKSWGYARALLIQAAQRPLRVLCAREVQKSIKQSVHTLLADQIQALGLGSIYEVLETEIRCKLTGSLFTFAGLATHTVESIKSFEGVDICWVEEAQTVSRRSWDILIPTIRKPGSEIWITFNPDLDTDDTYVRFVLDPPDDAVVAKINWSDNPWFPDVLEQERLDCQRRRPKDYDNIWEGKCKAAAEGAIYADEITDAQEAKRICNVPYDPLLKVHVVFDLGWNDSMAIGLVQRSVSEIRVIDYIEVTHKTLDWCSAFLRDMRLNWGQVWLPHDGSHADYKTGKSAHQILQALGWETRQVPNISVEAGIKLARMTFPRVYFDRRKDQDPNPCVRRGAGALVECLKNYKRAISNATSEPNRPVHDEWSHGADKFRYMCIVADQMSNEDWGDEYDDYDDTGRSSVGGY